MKNKFTIILTILAFVLLCVMACQQKQMPKTDPEKVVEITQQWSDALNNKNIDSLGYLYADTVTLYAETQSKYKVLANKAAFVKQHPDFKHTIKNIALTELDGGYYKTTFAKSVTYASKEINVGGQLTFEKQDGKWIIVSESDSSTEAMLDKKTAEEAKKEREAEAVAAQGAQIQTVQFEQKVTLSGKLGTTTYSDASANKYTVYVLTLTNPINVTTPNADYDPQNNVKEIQVGFNDSEKPEDFKGKIITIIGDIYGAETIHDRRPVVMIHAVIKK